MTEKNPPLSVAREVKQKAETPSLWSRTTHTVKKAYNPGIVPLALPSAPVDDEKYSYVSMNRKVLVILDLVSALAISAAMWLFVKSGPAFYWYAGWAVIVFLFLFPCYGVTVLGSSFDLEAHKAILDKYSLSGKTAPTVDIYLPVCKEDSEVLANTWKYIQRLRYPPGKVKVYVLDDGAEARVRELAYSFGFEYFVRDDRPHLKKAGNIRWAFARTRGDYYAIFDADFCPRADFLLETVPVALADPRAAIVQTPQFFRSTPAQSWVEQGAGPAQEYFYRVVQTTRNTWEAAVCVGSNAIYRREALAAIGGAAAVDSSEDIYTGMQLVERGWRITYVPLVLACGVCPATMRSYFAQQARWCSGTVTMLTKASFWRSELSLLQKGCYSLGFLYYVTTALGPFINPLPGPLLLWVNPSLFFYYNMFFAIPSIFYALVVMPLWARSRYPFAVQYIQVIVAYACVSALFESLLGLEDNWVPSGSNRKKKNNRYRNMRVLVWAWTILHYGNLITAVTYRLLNGFPWVQIVPLLALDGFNLFVSHKFLLSL